MSCVRVVVVSAVLMSAIACGGGYSSAPTSPSPVPSAAPPQGGVSSSVTIRLGAEALGDRAFSPTEIGVAAGGTVTWMNADTVTHTSTSNGSGWNSGLIAPGRQFTSAFPNPGTFPYRCSIHPGMVGVVVVR